MAGFDKIDATERRKTVHQIDLFLVLKIIYVLLQITKIIAEIWEKTFRRI
jgi:hypothetical protein